MDLAPVGHMEHSQPSLVDEPRTQCGNCRTGSKLEEKHAAFSFFQIIPQKAELDKLLRFNNIQIFASSDARLFAGLGLCSYIINEVNRKNLFMKHMCCEKQSSKTLQVFVMAVQPTCRNYFVLAVSHWKTWTVM